MSRNGISIIGRKNSDMASAARATVAFSTAHRKLGKHLAQTGCIGQLVVAFYPDGSFAAESDGAFSPAHMLEAASALNARAAIIAADVMKQQDLALAAREAAGGKPNGVGS